MNKKSIIISLLLGGVIGLLICQIRTITINEDSLSAQIIEQQELIESLQIDKENLLSINQDIVDKYYLDINSELDNIKCLLDSDRRAYIKVYKKIMENVEDPPETIYDYTTDEEFKLLCGVVEAESGICDFDGKCNVASTIINRYMSETFPNGWEDLLFQKVNGMYQYETIANGRYKKVEVTEDTILAIEYAFSISDTVSGATYFHSGSSEWHENSDKLEKVLEDKWHIYYKLKEE